jgi:hypothetical protein
MNDIPSSEHVDMFQVKHNADLTTISREVLLSMSPMTRTKQIEKKTFDLIEDCIVGDASRMEAIIAQICPKKKAELELMAHVIVSKALAEPQYCKACVSLSGALRLLLPALPSGPHKKGETFMHALLDVFQTQFEDILLDSSLPTFSNADVYHDEETIGGHWVTERNNRIRAIVYFAGHLYCHGLLGNGVVTQMVQDLVDNGASESANELLWFIGVIPQQTAEQQHLGTVPEDVGDSDGASSESISAPEARPACS